MKFRRTAICIMMHDEFHLPIAGDGIGDGLGVGAGVVGAGVEVDVVGA